MRDGSWTGSIRNSMGRHPLGLPALLRNAPAEPKACLRASPKFSTRRVRDYPIGFTPGLSYRLIHYGGFAGGTILSVPLRPAHGIRDYPIGSEKEQV